MTTNAENETSQPWLSCPIVSGNAPASAEKIAATKGRLTCESSEKMNLKTAQVSQIGMNVRRPVIR